MSSARENGKNRLAGESSPYLLLHQDNPVDWYPWGDEALERAREENKPIFLSVGYSTCYWCHVMERESFSDPAIAEVMNRLFINIKVDREERPDLDEVYMTATQLLTRQGGWPNSVFLTPQLEPFYAGTYFPPADAMGRPGFPTVLRSVAEAWEQREEQVRASAQQVAQAMEQALEQSLGPQASGGDGEPAAGLPGERPAQRALEELEDRFDATWGGFGGAPKFPTPSNLFLLLEMAEEHPQAESMFAATLDAMARGGIYDQLGGGFHRYSTDRQWLVPHFEKMLYDNGFLLELYARHHRRTGDAPAARVVRETAAFLAREMTGDGGGLWSAIDAETEGDEGAFYVWTADELAAALTSKELELVQRIYGADGRPNFEAGPHSESGRYVLHLPQPLAAALKEEERATLEAAKTKLFEARSQRRRPLTDDKILADWNGMAIAGLAVAGDALEEPELVAQAERAAAFVLDTLRPAGGTLLHSWRAGRSGPEAYLADYAFLVRGLLALHRVTGDGDAGEQRWLTAAMELTEEQVRRLRDPRGGFFVAAADPQLLFRSKDATDGAVPSANAVATLNLVDLAELTGEERWRREAEASLRAFSGLLEAAPQALGMMAIAAKRVGGEPSEEVTRAGRWSAGTEIEAEARRAVSSTLSVAEEEDGWRPFTLRVETADGWHINAHPASAEFLVATTVEGEGVELGAVRYPPGESSRTGFSETPVTVYRGSVEITGRLRPAAGEGARGGDEPRLVLVFQPCDHQRCLPPQRRGHALDEALDGALNGAGAEAP
ncbi:MAG: DUF255 domain-containing protein [Acidobacteriota bacterium]|nr:DUF255 domain-containing protein [Acidobacteriota bacterium]